MVRRAGEVLNRARVILKTEGLLVLWMRFLGETVYRRLLIFRVDLPLAGKEAAVCWAEGGDAVARVVQFNPELTPEEARRRLAMGHRCLMLKDEDEWVHCLWVATRDAYMDYLSSEFVLAAGEAYIYQTFTPPQHRGRGYATSANIGLGRMLLTEGYTRLVYCVQPDRAIAYPPLLRIGAKPVGYVGWFGVGRWRRAFRRTSRSLPFYARRFHAVRRTLYRDQPHGA
ncbi:MAG TPA: hypothetical protein VGK29_11860 [Paludibaculum sp.]